MSAPADRAVATERPSDSVPAPPAPSAGGRLAWIGLGLVALVAIVVRWRLLDVPLERDEGEYAYGGRLILDGLAPYEHLYNMKLPGIYAAYALILGVFGETARGIHTGLLVANLLTLTGLFLLVRRLFSPMAGVAAAAAFAVLSVGENLQGIWANAEAFVLPFVAFGTWFAVRALDTKKRGDVVACGLLLGCGLMVKQHAALFVAMAGVVFLIEAWRGRGGGWKPGLVQLGLYVAAALAPYLATCLIYVAMGSFDRFWFWTFEYARAYTQRVNFADGLDALTGVVGRVTGNAPYLWGLGIVGLSAAAWSRAVRGRWMLVVIFAVFSFLAITPGLLFRPHYFQLLLPACAIGVGALLHAGAGLLRNQAAHLRWVLGVGLVAGAGAQSLAAQSEFLFELSPVDVVRSTYRGNPFFESIDLAEFLRENTEPGEAIAVVGSEPQIYFYADRPAASGFMYTYPLMEGHEYALTMQRDFISEVERARPRYVVWVWMRLSWLWNSVSNTHIINWFQGFRQNYRLCRAIDLRPVSPTEVRSIVWDDANLANRPAYTEQENQMILQGQLPGYIEVYERR